MGAANEAETVANVLRENGMTSATDDTDTIAQRVVDALNEARATAGGDTGAQASAASETAGGEATAAGQSADTSAPSDTPPLAGTVEHNPDADPTQEPNIES